MSLTVQCYEGKHIPLVKAFNERLRLKGEGHQFPESCRPEWLPPRTDSSLHQEYFIVGDSDVVRGGFILKYQDFYINGLTRQIANIQSPISEGIIDPRFVLIGPVVLRNAIHRAPLMYSLGMGGLEEPITRGLHALRWKLVSIPFYFKVINATNFFLKNAYLRNSPVRRFVLDFFAESGIGSFSIHTLQRLRGKKLKTEDLRVEEIAENDPDIDEIWKNVRHQYSFIAVRDAKSIDILYPPEAKRFRRIKVYSGSRCIGWAVTLCTQMTAHKQFGSLCVGSIVDCLGDSEDAPGIVHMAAAGLEQQGADIIVANHSHALWGEAFEKNAFLRGPTNFIFGASVELTAVLCEGDPSCRGIFFMRGDGDGPINL